MRVSTLACSALVGFAAAAPYNPFPLADGFPKPNPAQLKTIQLLAGGSLPGGPLATKISPAAAVTLQLLALNEIFEVAYFTELLANVTNSVPGYSVKEHPHKSTRPYVLRTITAIQNQEKLHYLGVNAALAAAGQTTIEPCKYNIPVTTFQQAIELANTFTDVVLGVLPMAQTVFASDPATLPYVNLFGSVIAQEAEQNGWYRSVRGKVASAAPFLTTEGPAFAFTFLQSVIAPGCPGVDLVKKSIPTFGALTVVGKPTNKNSVVKYSVPGKVTAAGNSLVYLSGQNLPTSVPITNVVYKSGKSTFDAVFPFETQGFAKGLSIAAVVSTPSTKYATAADVAAKTLYGPGIIEVM